MHGQGDQFGEQARLLLRQPPGLGADHAARADVAALARVQWRYRVEADVGRPREQRVGTEALIVEGVGHHAQTPHRRRWRGCRRPPHAPSGTHRRRPGEEPLAILIDQRDQGDREAQHLARQPGDPVEVLVGLAIEDEETPQIFHTGRLIGRKGAVGH